MVIDTGSDWLVVVAEDCIKCTDQATFNPATSTSYKELSEDIVTQ